MGISGKRNHIQKHTDICKEIRHLKSDMIILVSLLISHLLCQGRQMNSERANVIIRLIQDI